MGCVGCGSKTFKSMKHLPLPEGRNGWVELSEWTDYCADCALKESIKINSVFNKSVGEASEEFCKRCNVRPKVNEKHMKLEICQPCFTSNA